MTMNPFKHLPLLPLLFCLSAAATGCSTAADDDDASSTAADLVSNATPHNYVYFGPSVEPFVDPAELEPGTTARVVYQVREAALRAPACDAATMRAHVVFVHDGVVETSPAPSRIEEVNALPALVVDVKVPRAVDLRVSFLFDDKSGQCGVDGDIGAGRAYRLDVADAVIRFPSDLGAPSSNRASLPAGGILKVVYPRSRARTICPLDPRPVLGLVVDHARSTTRIDGTEIEDDGLSYETFRTTVPAGRDLGLYVHLVDEARKCGFDSDFGKNFHFPIH